jgi:hypothetical protein
MLLASLEKLMVIFFCAKYMLMTLYLVVLMKLYVKSLVG